jgi:ribonuclease P protein component
MQAPRQQLKSLETLKKRSDFLKMNTHAEKWVAQGMILQALPNDLGTTRVGFTVTKRVDKSAVRRNRIKRRLRAAAADILPLYARASCDYVLIGRPQSATRPYISLKSDLKWCLDKMGFKKAAD